jgi:hypothetical protein
MRDAARESASCAQALRAFRGKYRAQRRRKIAGREAPCESEHFGVKYRAHWKLKYLYSTSKYLNTTSNYVFW